MMSATDRRCIWIWLSMVLLTLGAYAASRTIPDKAELVFAIVPAFIKARFVILDFMEVGAAPGWLRLLLESWAIALAALLLLVLSNEIALTFLPGVGA